MKILMRHMLVVSLVFILMLATLPIFGTQTDVSFSGAVLQGLKYDMGVDTDEDKTFDYLVVGVEIDVLDAGFYEVYVSGLLDSYFYYTDVYGSNSSFLDAGLRVLNVSLNGAGIYVSGRNPCYVNHIELWGGKSPYERYYYGSLNQVPLSKEYLYTAFDPPAAMLTGKINDWGIDTDSDQTYNYLVIGAEINVTKAGSYTLDVYGLHDKDWNHIDVWGAQSGYLDVGLGVLNVSLSGYRIRASQRNASFVSNVYLYADYPSSLYHVELSKEYSYTEFDALALFTKVLDQGRDTDSDGAFNFLEIDVEVNVFEPGNYGISISGLLDSDFNHIDVYASKSLPLEAGLQFVNFTLEGPRIHLSRRNPRYIRYISLWFEGKEEYREGFECDHLSEVSLSKQYYYTDFDPPGAMLTGRITDQGVDTDADGKLDYLEVGVEVMVTESGTYIIWVSGLFEVYFGDKNETNRERYYISVSDSKTTYLDKGVQTVNLYLYGPQIYVSRHNPTNVSYIGVIDTEYRYYDSLRDVPCQKNTRTRSLRLLP